MTVSTNTHIKVGFANPYLTCDVCSEFVPYWHDPDRCGCNGEVFNYPCKHSASVTSVCYSWSPVDGCTCTDKENHDRPD